MPRRVHHTMPVLTVIYPSPRSTRCWPLGVRECGVPVTRRWRWRQGGRQGGRAAGRAAGCSAAGEGLLRCERWAALCGALQPPQAEDLLHPRPRLAHQLLVDARRRTQRVRAHLVPSTSHDIHGNSWPAAASCSRARSCCRIVRTYTHIVRISSTGRSDGVKLNRFSFCGQFSNPVTRSQKCPSALRAGVTNRCELISLSDGGLGYLGAHRRSLARTKKQE